MTREEAKARFFVLTAITKRLTKKQAKEALLCYKIMFPRIKKWNKYLRHKLNNK